MGNYATLKLTSYGWALVAEDGETITETATDEEAREAAESMNIKIAETLPE